MARHGPVKASLEWLWFNACVEALRPLGGPVTRLRYEDFVAAPRERIEDILEHCGHEHVPGDLDFIAAESVVLGTDHSVAGNPMRVRTGRLPLRLDDEWRTRMRPGTRRLVTVLTLPGCSATATSGSDARSQGVVRRPRNAWTAPWRPHLGGTGARPAVCARPRCVRLVA